MPLTPEDTTEDDDVVEENMRPDDMLRQYVAEQPVKSLVIALLTGVVLARIVL